jgi:phosphate transport system substrate-binding protein
MQTENSGIWDTLMPAITRSSLIQLVAGVGLAIASSMSAVGQVVTASDAVLLRGAGSTFAAPLYKRWIEEYAVVRPSVSIAYEAVGSGEGVRRFLSDAVDFAGSDETLPDKDSAKAGGAIMVPATAGMIVITYNIPGVTSEIKLPRDVYVDIFAGAVRRWDDPRIQAANPGISFPPRGITIVARQDGSGTTAAFTRHLDAVGPAWRQHGMRVGNIIDWPKGTTLVPGNEGVASNIPTIEGSIGYVEFWFAQRLGLRMAALQNRAGKYITPTPLAGDLALSGRVAQVTRLEASVADPPTSAAYPIPSFSWVLLYPGYLNKAKSTALRDFAQWGLSQQAQDYAAQIGYLGLPADVIALGQRALKDLGN